MIGGLIAAAHFLVDRHRLQFIGSLGGQKQMVDADAVVLLPGARLIIPKGVEAGSVRGRAQGVDQTEREQFAELETRLR